MVANKTSSKKAKGTRLEKYVSKRINQVLKEYGVEAKRMPMSGAIDGFKSDIFVNLPVSFGAGSVRRVKRNTSPSQSRC